MSKRKHQEEILINIYNFNKEKIKELKNSEIEMLLLKKQKEEIAISKNPNKFWHIKGMPVPKEIKPKTNKIYGFLIICALFLVLIGFLVMFTILAFLNN